MTDLKTKDIYVLFKNVRGGFLIPLLYLLWIFICGLYALRLSDILVGSPLYLILIIALGVPSVFFLGHSFAALIYNPVTIKTELKINLSKLLNRSKSLTLIFVLLVSVEFVVEGYVPLWSMIKGRGISQFEFGISSLHGLVLSIGALLFTAWFTIWYVTRKKSAILWASLILMLFVLLVTRKMLLVSLSQAIVVTLFLSDSKKIYIGYITAAFLTVLVFGWIGDIRTGREIFLSVSHFNVTYPDWLPTGFGWIYIYVTTPIANFSNAILSNHGFTYDFSFLAGLFPRFARVMLFDLKVDDFAYHDWQISSAFNVGTGFVGIYESFGGFGVFLFIFLLGFVYRAISRRIVDISKFLFVVVFFQCTLFLIFGNNFLNLNTVAQLIFIPLLFRVRYKI